MQSTAKLHNGRTDGRQGLCGSFLRNNPMGQAEDKAAERTYRSIGRFMFEFSQVEYTIRHYLANEIGLKDEYFSAVVESYDVAMLTKVAIEVFKKSRTANAASIEKLLNRFRKMNGDRNRVSHGLWVPFKDGGTVHHVSRNKLKSSPSTDQADELERKADKLSQLRSELEQAFLAMPELDRHPNQIAS
jgi:hypothetical protein